jgi:PAS domain S-box-containing protein
MNTKKDISLFGRRFDNNFSENLKFMTKTIDIKGILRLIILAALFYAGLHMANMGSFLLFHNIVEGFSIVVAIGIFMFAWNSREFMENDFFLFLGIAYLFIGLMDFVHMLAYEGMQVFVSGGGDLSAQAWIATRFMEAVSLVIATWFAGKRINVRLTYISYSMAFIIIILSLFHWKNFPTCFTHSAGLTSFKIICEYIISAIFLLAMYLMVKKRKHFDETVFNLLIVAIFVTIMTELVFTLYAELTGFLNVFGHILKIISFYLIYKAIISSGYKKPYNLLFRELKSSQEAVKKEKDFVENIFKTAQVIILVLDTNGRIVRFNPYLEKITGYKLEEVLGRDWFSIFISGEQGENVKRKLMQSLDNADSNGDITQITAKDGVILDIEWSVKFVKDFEGKVVGLLAIGHDVTKTNRIMSELQESETKFRQLFLAESDAIVVFDEETKQFIDVNDAAIKLYGYSPEEFLNLKITDISEDVSEIFMETGEIYIGRILEQSVTYHKKKNGERFPAEVSMGKFNWQGRKMICQVIRDVADREKMEKELLERNRELTNFAYMVSHDLKSPLSLIMGYLAMIREEPELFDECYDTVMKQAEGMGELIDSLLQLSRAGKVIAQKEEIDLKTMAYTVFSLMKSGDFNAELSVASDLPKIMGDPDRMSQVLKNLITNSIQHYDPDKDKLHLEITHECHDNNVIFKFKDNGSGIKKEIIDKVFDSGFTYGKKRGFGTGFGLPIIKKVVEAHGGEVWLHSGGEKMGTEFYLRFPLV